jgi:hypothetical protein
MVYCVGEIDMILDSSGQRSGTITFFQTVADSIITFIMTPTKEKRKNCQKDQNYQKSWIHMNQLMMLT